MLSGDNFIAGERRGASGSNFMARDPATGAAFEPPFATASDSDVADACRGAAQAQPGFAELPLSDRSAFLRLVAEKIDALGEVLTKRAMAETGLPHARLEGERGRTVGQLRLFADVVERGDWQRARIDHGDPGRTPPKPDLRLRMIPLGPVAVFGASNFPLAFSVAGGDTASAFAAGCCVVVKGHPAHPGTSELVAGAIAESVADMGLPGRVFSLLQGAENALGEALVKHPDIAAVGFTGSRAGGLALMEHAANRAVPIPVFAEMSSVNPVVLMPGRLDEAAEDLAASYAASLSLGAGQFCTNPGVVLGIEGRSLDRFRAALVAALPKIPGQTMLTTGIRENFEAGAKRLAETRTVELAALGEWGTQSCGQAQVYTVKGDDFLSDPSLSEEIFGPASILVRCRDIDQVRTILAGMEGQLTATVHMARPDYAAVKELLPVLEQLAGRIIANGWPTGVEVTHAMVHGGPFPATSDGRSTSVGTMAMERFLRPVAYQDMPEELLPAVLTDSHDGPARMIDGEM